VYDLADPDDGCLQTERRVDGSGLDAYLTATGDFEHQHTEAAMDPVEAHPHPAVAAFVDSDTEGVEEEVQEQALEQQFEDVVNNDGQASMLTVDPDVDDVTDYKDHEPLDLGRMLQLLTDMRHRGGDFEGDDQADDIDDSEGGPVEGEQVQAEAVPIEGHLAEPLWTTQVPAECRLKQLQVSV
jgi:hypothetical protein